MNWWGHLAGWILAWVVGTLSVSYFLKKSAATEQYSVVSDGIVLLIIAIVTSFIY